MPELPHISGRKAIKTFESLGFEIVRQKAVMWFCEKEIKVV